MADDVPRRGPAAAVGRVVGGVRVLAAVLVVAALALVVGTRAGLLPPAWGAGVVGALPPALATPAQELLEPRRGDAARPAGAPEGAAPGASAGPSDAPGGPVAIGPDPAPASVAPPAVSPPGGPRPEGWPSRSAESAPGPLGSPPPVPATGGAHAFLETRPDGSPVAYDPCRPLHWVVNAVGAPSGADELVAEAVARIAAATGLRFVADGATDEPPAPARPSFQPERYGDRWAPVLVAWVTPDDASPLAGDVAGLGGSTAFGLDGGPLVWVTGQVQLDAPQLAEAWAGPGGRDLVLAVVTHELAHVVGLDHVDDPGQLMYAPTRAGVTDLADGDRAGLAALGTGPCAPEV
ncbi:matrixin family metalloprotease [Cellulomonas marina]|uniref:Matrixin n=1 Tax=Cellulomonas marina TaxID=988821 RepID=A0A1I0ZFT1_9CELL|nr:matrixin family metalloprotease [Cellulomonas marina]GIG30745.1 hypothetical protein Cma02nite_33450 [Cellulomonas marina]SFB23258.1 Matrixin [Cellulomonas marina]